MPGPTTGTFPATAADMDVILGFEGERIPDLPPTPGRNKVVWRVSANVKITYEAHPYHLGAPMFHRVPHWHLDTPTVSHQRYMPGDPFPDW